MGLPIRAAPKGDIFLFVPAPFQGASSSLYSPPPLSSWEEKAGEALGRPFSMAVGSGDSHRSLPSTPLWALGIPKGAFPRDPGVWHGQLGLGGAPSRLDSTVSVQGDQC